jgi:hypothetical protein
VPGAYQGLHTVKAPRADRSTRRKIDRQRRVATLRLSGVSDQRRIAAELGVSQSTVSRDFADLDAAFRAAAAQDIAVAAGLDLARIEALIEPLWADAAAGVLPVVDRVVKLLGRRARLLGLEAPVRVDVRLLVRRAAERHGLSADEERVLFDRITDHLAEQRGGPP